MAETPSMPPRIRLVHKTLGGGRFHVFTSPDLKGFHIASEDLAEAQREAILVLDDIAGRRGWPTPVVEFVFAPEAVAA